MSDVLLSKPGRFLFIALILLVAVLRIKHEAYFPELESDYGVQIEAAKNFTEGKGFSNCVVDPANLGHAACTPLRLWPVGYAMLLVPVYYITHSWFAACIFWQSVGALLLVFLGYKILRLFNVKAGVLLLFLLFMAFSPTPFYYLAPTDMLSVDIFLFCLLIIMRGSLSDRYTRKDFILVGALSAVNCFLRFASIPNLVIFPLFFLLAGFYRKNKKLVTGAFVTGGVSLLLVFAFFSVYRIDSSRTGFMHNLLSLNLYYSHLKWFDSFPVKSFFYARPLEYRLPPSHTSLIRWMRILLHLASLFFLCLLAWKFLVKEKVHRYLKQPAGAQRMASDYFYIFLISAAVIIGFMVLQSLTTPPEANSFGPAWMPHFWTFVYMTRYFALLMVMLEIAFFVLLSRIVFREEKIPGTLAYVFFCASLVYGAGFWLFTTWQIHSPGGNGGGSFWRNYADHVSFYKEINRIADEEKKSVVFASYDMGMNAPVMLYSKGKPCRDYEGLLKSDLAHSSPLSLLVEMPKESMQDEAEKNFVAMRGAREIVKFKESILYRIDLP